MLSREAGFSEMEVVLLPGLRCSIQMACDVPAELTEVLEEWSSKFPKGLDCRHMNQAKPYSWFVEDMDASARDEIEATYMPSHFGCLAVLQEKYPSGLE